MNGTYSPQKYVPCPHFLGMIYVFRNLQTSSFTSRYLFGAIFGFLGTGHSVDWTFGPLASVGWALGHLGTRSPGHKVLLHTRSLGT